MTSLLLDILGTWIRAGAIALSAYLVQRHLVTSQQGDRLSMELVTHLLLIAPAALGLLWGTMKSIWQRRAVLVALMPGIHTFDDVQAQLKTGIAPTVHTPTDTRPGVPL